jgi:DNA-binding transcriptional regulator YiaG
MEYLAKMVLGGAAPRRGAKKHAAPQGGPEMPRLLCCRISQTHLSESARSSAAHTGHFRPIAIPAITWTDSWQITALRKKKVRASQAVVARIMNASVQTIHAWEQGRGQPSGPALRLLRLLDKRPDLIREFGKK